VADFRSDKMESPEGYGIARRAWDAYYEGVTRASRPAVEKLVGPTAASTTVDLIGFWVVWHLHGGFEGLRKLGMSRSAIYRKIGLFRLMFGEHPDAFEMPGVHLDVAEYLSWKPAPKKK